MPTRKILLVIILSVLFQNTATGQDFKTIGYLPTYRFYTIEDIAWHQITHLNIAFANPDADGKLSTKDISISPVVQRAHDVGVKVFISLGGAGAQLSDWEDWITPDKRSSFISGLVEYVNQNELQGVDVDLEWGTVNSDYSGFVLELKDSLDPKGIHLTAALPGQYRYPEISNEALAAYDWVNLMVYDKTGPWTPNNPGPHSPYSMAENSISYWASQGLEKNKMTLGVPFYGYDFTDLDQITAVTYAQMVDMDTANSQLDQVGEIYYNGLSTIGQKTTLALNGLGGLMIWELGQDHFGAFSLLKRVYETIEAFQTSHAPYADGFKDMKVYPNPASKYVRVNTGTLNEVKITMFSSSGRMLHSQQHNSKAEIEIKFADYPPGIYFLYVESKMSVKIVKLVKL